MLAVDGLYAGYSEEPVLSAVSMRAQKGRITGIIGPNGCGKSTFLKAVVGLVPPARGQVRFMGQDITRHSPFETLRLGLAYIPQGRQVFPDMTLLENLQMAAFSLRDQSVVRERFKEAFARFPILYERQRQVAGTLSGGEQSMLSFAMALVVKPSCMLLDEPSLGLSPAMVERVFTDIVELNEDGMTLVIIEQNIRVLLEVADYVYILDAGRNRFDGTPAEVTGEEELMKLYMGVRA
jgi:branched-chain amino acid transport system ATP-binding protein